MVEIDFFFLSKFQYQPLKAIAYVGTWAQVTKAQYWPK